MHGNVLQIIYWIYTVTLTLQNYVGISLQWRHNEQNGVSNHQPHACLLNRLFRHRSEKTSKLRITGLCVRISPVTSEIPAQRTSNAESFFIRWRHHVAATNQNPSLNLQMLILGVLKYHKNIFNLHFAIYYFRLFYFLHNALLLYYIL